MTTASARAAPSAVPLPAQQHVAGGSHGPWRLLSDAAPQEKAELVIGVVGMGDMGRLYVSKFLAGGWQQVHVCDLPSKYDALKHEYAHDPRVTVHEHGALVARKADLLIFSVEAAFLADVVRACGPAIRPGAIVSAQTSVKAPEYEAFEAHLPSDVFVVSVHSLHGPKVDTAGQPLVLIQHRAPDNALHQVERVFHCFHSRYVYLSYQEHDIVTANTQAVTHAAFLSMGTAWFRSNDYPWETTRYPGGIETVKINIMLRIYAAKWHVYAGLALLNPAARVQVEQYAKSTSELFKLMIGEDEAALVKKVFAARQQVFGWGENEEAGFPGEAGKTPARKPILLSDRLLDRFHLAAWNVVRAEDAQSDSTQQQQQQQQQQQPKQSQDPPLATPPAPNSHLALLAIVDCWAALGIDPYAHLEVAATPVFRIWIGVCEYLFRSPERLRAACHAAVRRVEYRSDDVEFTIAARGWAEAVRLGAWDVYRARFEETRAFFEPRFEEANKVGAQMLKEVIAQSN